MILYHLVTKYFIIYTLFLNNIAMMSTQIFKWFVGLIYNIYIYISLYIDI